MTAVVAAVLSAAWKLNACSDDDVVVDHGDTPRPSRRNTIVRMLAGMRETAMVNSAAAMLIGASHFAPSSLENERQPSINNERSTYVTFSQNVKWQH